MSSQQKDKTDDVVKTAAVTDSLRLAGKTYPTRDVFLAEYNVTVKVSTEELDKAVYKEPEGYTSREAELIDELIFMYIPEDMMDAPVEELSEYICERAWS